MTPRAGTPSKSADEIRDAPGAANLSVVLARPSSAAARQIPAEGDAQAPHEAQADRRRCRNHIDASMLPQAQAWRRADLPKPLRKLAIMQRLAGLLQRAVWGRERFAGNRSLEAPGIEPGSRDVSAPASTCVVARLLSPAGPEATRSAVGQGGQMSRPRNRPTLGRSARWSACIRRPRARQRGTGYVVLRSHAHASIGT